MTDELVTRLRKKKVGDGFKHINEDGRNVLMLKRKPDPDALEAANRIEADAATIARLEGELGEAREQARMNSFAGEGYVYMERRAEAAEAKLAQAVEVLRGFVTAWGKTYHGASQGDARQAQMDALAKQVDRARAVIDNEDRKGGA